VTKEPVVLDAEGNVLHDPGPKTKVYRWNTTGIIPKILVGTLLGALLFMGLTIAGIVLGVLFVGFIGKLLFGPFFRQTRR